MKRILFIFAILAALTGCNDDDSISFNSELKADAFRFTPKPGGAMMYYNLPDDSDIFAINVRYQDAHGINVLKVGGYAGDSLLLDGFNEARKNVTAQVSFVDNRNNESSPIDVTFDTEDSAPYAFLETVSVSSSWDGFQVVYDSPGTASGMAHVFYLGTNPMTQQSDTILVRSFPILKGGDTLVFSLQQKNEKNTIVVRTEDYSGFRVGQKIWQDIETYVKEKFPMTPDNFDADGMSLEKEENKIGVQYLFDGDLKGTERYKANDEDLCYTFAAGPNMMGRGMYVDFKKPKVPASIRIYGTLAVNNLYFSPNPFGLFYEQLLPCDVTIFASNDKTGDNWVKVGSYSVSPTQAYRERWTYRCNENGYPNPLRALDELETAEPCYLEISFVASPEAYRYLKIVVNDTFIYCDAYDPSFIYDANESNYVTMNELEVYVKKEDL